MSLPDETDDAKPRANGDRAVPQASPLEDLNILQRELRNLIHDQLQLAALEVRLAARSLMTMITAAICIAVLLVLAWVGLMAATGLSLIGMGLQPVYVLLLVTALTVVFALLLHGFNGRRSRHLGLPATLRTLKSPVPGAPDGEAT